MIFCVVNRDAEPFDFWCGYGFGSRSDLKRKTQQKILAYEGFKSSIFEKKWT